MGEIKLFKPIGNRQIDILPLESKSIFYYHYDVKKRFKSRQAFICKGIDCPICSFIEFKNAYEEFRESMKGFWTEPF